MGKTYETIITRFDGGLSEDKRSTNASKFSLTKHFDVFTYPHKLVPFNKTEAFAGEDKTKGIVKFLYAPRTFVGSVVTSAPVTFKLFGFGSNAANSTPRIYMQDPGDSTWSTPSNNSGTGVRNTKVFFYYKGYIYLFTGGANLGRFDVTSSGAFSSSYQSIAYVNIAPPVHHLGDDCAYFFADNIVYRLNNTTWDGSVLTLPTNLKIVSAVQYGNYLAIGCSTLGDYAKRSIVFLWDRDSSLSTVSERIDLGEGELKHFANLDNQLIGVVEHYLSNDFGLKRGSVFIRRVNGTSYIDLQELKADTTISTANGGVVQDSNAIVKNNKLYFPMRLTLNGDTRFGIWVTNSLGKVSLAFIEEEATSYEGIYNLANAWWIAHSNDGSTNVSTSPADYSTTLSSVYESLILNNGKPWQKKKLVGVTVMTEPMPSAGQIVLKYRKDEETSWTTIFTHSTDSSISHSSINIESTKANLPEHKEIQFQINSTGGAVITGIRAKFEEIDKDTF